MVYGNGLENPMGFFLWACGSVGRALRSHRRGQGFESPQVHQNKPTKKLAGFEASFFYFVRTERLSSFKDYRVVTT